MNLGHLYVIRTTLTRPPKDKLVICVCAEKNLFLWITTRPRPDGIGQLPLLATDHPALTKACFLDCSRLTTFLPAELNAAQDRGRISGDLAAKIDAFVALTTPETLTERQRGLIRNNLHFI